jgi:rsbT antagonist protein RsbS
MRQFSTRSRGVPIIQVWNQLLVPLQGDLLDEQAARLGRDVLQAIGETGAKGLVIDVSGLSLIDSHLCALLARIAKSAALMGTRSVLAGISPETAMSLLTMDVELEGVTTALNLEAALRVLGVRAEPRSDETTAESSTGEPEDAAEPVRD